MPNEPEEGILIESQVIGSVAMIPREVCLLRVYANAKETSQGISLYRAVVEAVRRRKRAGASVFPVDLGYGTHRQLHDIASEYSSFDIPIVVEIVDTAEQVDSLAGELQTMLHRGPCRHQGGSHAPFFARD